MEISLDESSQSFLEILFTDKIAFVFKEKVWELSLVFLDLEGAIIRYDGSNFQQGFGCFWIHNKTFLISVKQQYFNSYQILPYK